MRSIGNQEEAWVRICEGFADALRGIGLLETAYRADRAAHEYRNGHVVRGRLLWRLVKFEISRRRAWGDVSEWLQIESIRRG